MPHKSQWLSQTDDLGLVSTIGIVVGVIPTGILMHKPDTNYQTYSMFFISMPTSFIYKKDENLQVYVVNL